MPKVDRKMISKIKKKYGVDDIYSYSKLSTYIRDPYEYFLKYVLKKKPDLDSNAYGWMGGKVHDILERFYNNEITYEQMYEEWEDVVLEFDMSGLKYDKRDSTANGKIKKKYQNAVSHFFKNHIVTNADKRINEAFIVFLLGRFLFQGFIDVTERIGKKEIEEVIVTDYKTSTIYKNDKKTENAGQLISYGIGIHQRNKIPYDKIKLRWNFLKYVEVSYQLKNGNTKTRIIERISLMQKLESQIVTKMKTLGYDNTTINNEVSMVKDLNSIDSLPDDVKDQFIIGDCYVYVDINEEIVDRFTNRMIVILEEIEEKTKKYHETKDEKLFWKEVTDKDTYYLNNLGGYSSKLHAPWNAYKAEKAKYSGSVKDEDDLIELLGEDFFEEVK
jgi:hypothetical protein